MSAGSHILALMEMGNRFGTCSKKN